MLLWFVLFCVGLLLHFCVGELLPTFFTFLFALFLGRGVLRIPGQLDAVSPQAISQQASCRALCQTINELSFAADPLETTFKVSCLLLSHLDLEVGALVH